MASRGRFIAIEGGDGSGKRTQSDLLQAYADKTISMNVMKVSFPRYGEDSAYYVEQYLNGAYGNDASADLTALPYAIDRFAASGDIAKHLAKPNGLVIADRYVASNLAHQGAKIANDAERHTFYERMMKTEYGVLGIPRPDHNIVLLVPTTIAQQNVDKKDKRGYTDRKRDILEADASHLEKAKANYIELCQLYPSEFTAIDCTNSDDKLRPIGDIQAEIRQLIGLPEPDDELSYSFRLATSGA